MLSMFMLFTIFTVFICLYLLFICPFLSLVLCGYFPLHHYGHLTCLLLFCFSFSVPGPCPFLYPHYFSIPPKSLHNVEKNSCSLRVSSLASCTSFFSCSRSAGVMSCCTGIFLCGASASLKFTHREWHSFYVWINPSRSSSKHLSPISRLLAKVVYHDLKWR